jgi:hypothetical protein
MPSFYGEPGYFGDVVADLQNATDADTIAGMNALNTYWRFAKELNPQIPQDFVQFLLALQQTLTPGKSDNFFKMQIRGIGTEVNVGGTPGYFSTESVVPMKPGQVNDAMEALAKKGGRVPSDMNVIRGFLTDTATQVQFLPALLYTMEATGGDVVVAVKESGEKVLEVAKNVEEAAVNVSPGIVAASTNFQYLIYAAAGLVAIIAYSKFGGSLFKKNRT